MLKYSDFNYTSDKQNQKLILKYIYIFEDESVLWVSQKQKFIIILIIEIKYIIMLICIKIEIWLKQMLRDMSIDKYFEVNLYCISIQKNKAH